MPDESLSSQPHEARTWVQRLGETFALQRRPIFQEEGGIREN